MKHILLTTMVLAICCTTKRPKALVSSDSTQSEEKPDSAQVIDEKKLSVSDLIKATERVELVAYPYRKNLGKSMSGTLIQGGEFMAIDIKERLDLRKDQTKVLLSILSRPKIPTDSLSGADCYNPQHVILFYQKKKVAAFLELCFSCRGDRHTSHIDFGIIGEEKLCMLEQFFIASKINYGINKDQYKFECGEILGLK